ncbi:MAG: MFS transporter [Phycisphaerae bacterium]|nr:MFS transporter [Phycisphaerae bacterium]
MTAGAGEPARGAGARLLGHVAAIVLIQSTYQSIFFMLAILAKKRFGANDWEVLIITSAQSVLAISSIFWNDLLRRASLERYLAAYWGCTFLPLALAALFDSFWPLAAAAVLAAIGGGGWSPVTGLLLKRFYRDGAHGRIYSVLSATQLAGSVALTWVVGELLRWDSASFRVFLPVAALAQMAGCVLLLALARRSGLRGRPETAEEPDATLRERVIEPILHMRRILAADRIFYRYEAAFMTYGIGWMVCAALIPALVTDRLGLAYDRIAESTQVVTHAVMLLLTVPCGWILDRLGPTRTSGLFFLIYAAYPLMLVFTHDDTQLKAASAIYGLAAAGVNLGWMLGPVALAPTRAQVPQYVAIHTTLVGLRGALFQFLGVMLYKLTGSLTVPLLVAAAGFLWGAWQMRELDRRMRAPAGPAPA